MGLGRVGNPPWDSALRSGIFLVRAGDVAAVWMAVKVLTLSGLIQFTKSKWMIMGVDEDRSAHAGVSQFSATLANILTAPKRCQRLRRRLLLLLWCTGTSWACACTGCRGPTGLSGRTSSVLPERWMANCTSTSVRPAVEMNEKKKNTYTSAHLKKIGNGGQWRHVEGKHQTSSQTPHTLKGIAILTSPESWNNNEEQQHKMIHWVWPSLCLKNEFSLLNSGGLQRIYVSGTSISGR